MSINNKFLYHYTSVSALTGILNEGNKLKFWATHYNYLNDKKEGICGFELLQECTTNEIITELSDYYLIAFSKEPASIPMWNSYADNGNGIVLKIDRNKLFQFTFDRGVQIGECVYNPERLELLENWYREKYNNLEKLDKISANEEVYKNAEQEVEIEKQFLLQNFAVFKEKCWRYEKEVRAIFREKNDVKFRVRNNLLIPYIEIDFDGGILTEIILSPKMERIFERQKKSLDMLLKNNGFEHVEISLSNTPLQD